MRIRTLLTVIFCLTLSLGGQAKTKPVVQYDFSAISNGVIKDKSSHLDGTLQGSAKAVKENGTQVVDLGYEGGYIDMGAALGARFKDMKALTIAVKYFVEEKASLKGNGYFLWAFSVLDLNTAETGRYHAYKLNYQRSETTASGWSHETTLEIGHAADKGAWQYAVYTQDGKDGRLYLNGEQVAANPAMLTMQEAFAGEAPVCNWIGRAPFKGDSFLAGTKIAAVSIYDKALSAEEVKKWSGQ